jgi:hypothetical protein
MLLLRKSDDEVRELTHNVQHLQSELSTLQKSATLDQKQQSAIVAGLERKVDECMAVSASAVQTVGDRSAKLEDIVRATELAMRAQVTDTKSEVRLASHSSIAGDNNKKWFGFIAVCLCLVGKKYFLIDRCCNVVLLCSLAH